MLLTARDLYRWNACISQRLWFDDVWPRGAEVTADNVKRAIECEMDVEWLLGRLYNRFIIDWSPMPEANQFLRQYWEDYATLRRVHTSSSIRLDAQFHILAAKAINYYMEAGV